MQKEDIVWHISIAAFENDVSKMDSFIELGSTALAILEDYYNCVQLVQSSRVYWLKYDDEMPSKDHLWMPLNRNLNYRIFGHFKYFGQITATTYFE